MKRSQIIALIGIIAAIGIITTVAMLNVRPYLTVTQVYENPSRYYGDEIQVIGIVMDMDNNFLNLTEEDQKLMVDTSNIQVPVEIVNGIQVVVTGIYDENQILHATQIISQCSNENSTTSTA